MVDCIDTTSTLLFSYWMRSIKKKVDAFVKEI